MNKRTVLLAGGGGVVGQQVAAILRRRHPQMHIVLGGRRIEPLRAVAKDINVEAVAFDIDAPVIPEGMQDPIVVGLANDLGDHLLTATLRAGLSYIDVTRWTERIKQALVVAASHGVPTAPIVFSSAWMASTTALVARAAAKRLAHLDRIDIDVLYALADRAGPNSTAYMDRISEPFFTLENASWIKRRGLRDGHRSDFAEGRVHTTYRFDTPDQASLPALTGAHTVNARIAFDDAMTTGLMHGLVVSGIWGLLSRPAFDGVRRAMLYNPGAGAPHRVRISLHGRDPHGSSRTEVVQLVDTAGQTHLTALGAVLQVEHLLGLHGTPPAPGIHLGEATVDPALAVAFLQSEGVQIAPSTN